MPSPSRPDSVLEGAHGAADDRAAAPGSAAPGSASSATPAGGGTTFAPWWGPLELDADSPRRWRIGPRRLWMSRRRQEFSVAHAAGDDPLDASLELGVPDSENDIPESAHRMRFALSQDAPAPELVPALADRAAIVRPDAPLVVPPDEEVTLYVSSPVWLVIRLPANGSEDEPRTLLEVPTWRPSDTWFGPDTLRGELAYALATTGRFELDPTGPPHRTTTPIRVRNREPAPLRIERLKVPLPNLSLYATDRRLWTTALTLDHDEDEERTALELTSGAPREAGTDAVRLAPPREATSGNLVMRAFARIFRGD